MKFVLEYLERRPIRIRAPRDVELGSVCDLGFHEIEAPNLAAAEKLADILTKGKTLISPAVLKPYDEYLAERAAFVKSVEEGLAALDAKEEGGAGTFKTGIPCRTYQCSGEVVKEVRREYRGDPMHQIIGPGGRNQLSTIVSYYCPTCQVMYRGLPGE